ncbi:MAG: hypothetical protein WAV12_30710 [Trebonia sp.]
MAPDLRVAPAQGGEHGERDQLPHLDTDPVAGEVVAEAVGRQEPLEVQLVLGRRRVHALHPVRAGDPLLHRPPSPSASVRRGGGLSVERQPHTALAEDVVGGVDEVDGLAHPRVRHSLVHDLPGLDRCDPGGEGGAEHDPVLAERLAADESRELDHQPGPGVEAAVPQHLVEGEVVEDLDQLRIGDLQRGDAARVRSPHHSAPTRTSDLMARRSSMAR